jgi:prevent-host-death family protein
VQIDLKHGVIPISKAASALAALIKRAGQERRPVVITQKGFPSAVLLDVDSYLELVAAAEGRPVADPAEVGS